jgi:hypothetical protein
MVMPATGKSNGAKDTVPENKKGVSRQTNSTVNEFVRSECSCSSLQFGVPCGDEARKVGDESNSSLNILNAGRSHPITDYVTHQNVFLKHKEWAIIG